MKKLNEILKNQLSTIKEEPVRVFALVYPYILVIGIGFGIFYINNLNSISRQSIQPVLPDTTRVEELKVIPAKSIPSIDIFALSQPTDSLINNGKVLFKTNCAACHGEEGKGDGAGGAALNSPPRNFTNKDGWKNGQKISQMYQTLQEGIPGSGMIAYDFILPKDRLAIIHYIRNAFISDAPLNSKDELMTLDQLYSLSKGLQISPQISVGAAIEVISKENDQKFNNIITVLNKINDDKIEEGAELFKNVTKDRMRALTVLSSSLDWKQSTNKFISFVMGSFYNSGFSSSVANLSKEEWNTLYNFMTKRI